ncbi:putative ionotropic glutamate receptor [Helianthus anomalus]
MIQIPLKKFDAVAGDVAIRSSRLDYLDFTQPSTELGLEMVVPVKSKLSNQPWLFMKPFTVTHYLRLYSFTGDKLHSNLSRMVVVVWLFVALIITQSDTASFTSMLTAQRLEPTITNIEVLRYTNATIGY